MESARKRRPSPSPSVDSVSLKEKEKERLLDFDFKAKAAQEISLETFQEPEKTKKKAPAKSEDKKKKPPSGYVYQPKLNLIVGFLRLANYVSASTVLFGLAVALFFPRQEDEDDAERAVAKDFLRWQNLVYAATGWVQVIYLCVLALLVLVDSVGTVTFRWKEYGELTHSQADATSVIFLICGSRWTLRAASGLIMATAVSQRTLRIAKLEQFAPFQLEWYFALSLASFASALIGFLLSLSPWHRVNWLYDRFDQKHVEDKGDVWTKTWGKMSAHLMDDGKCSKEIDQDKVDKPDASKQFITQNREECFGLKCVVFTVSKLVFLSAFLLALYFHITAMVFMFKSEARADIDEDVELWVVITSFVACGLLSLACVIFIVLDAVVRCNVSRRVPLLLKLLAPFCLSSSMRCMLETEAPSAAVTKLVASYAWIYLMAFMLLFFCMELCFDILPVGPFCASAWRFIRLNVKEEGVNKKTIRFLDTLGSILALSAFILGMTSLFIDQYDLEFAPEGFAKEFVDACKDFEKAVKPVTVALKTVIDELDKHFLCEDVFKALGTGTAITLFASFFPGASSVASVGARSAYYGVRAANAFTNLAAKLRKSKNIIWQVVRSVIFIQKFTAGNLKKLIVASNFTSIAKLLPFLPPVVLGMYVLYGTFFPHRVLFFSSKQRRKSMASMLYSWTLALLVLSIAIAINTAFVDEVVRLLDENIPLARVTLERKLGWNLAMAASAFSLAACLSFWIASFILKWQTDKNHENITNAELDWKDELEKRELLVIKTAIGDKIEKRTQLKYKKERIGPWTWMLPITICLISCGFGVLANINPKLEFALEPKGTFGRLIDRTFREISFYENDMYQVRNDTDRECLPYTSFHDVMNEYGYKNVLMNPVYHFFNQTEKIVRPLRDSLNGMRKQLLLDVQEELFGDSLENVWNANNLQYLGMLFLVPRVICLLILLFGCVTSSIWVCQMRIIESIDPAHLVAAYGKVALFSVIYVLGAQFALFNLISAFGIPFYHITIRFGLGFIYDLVADFILVSVYVGMSNQFFFAIPKRKTMVVYSVPGASDEGPMRQGQVI